jgi:hypothetical protein
MLPSNSGLSIITKPKLLRVCDACLHSTETFEFRPLDLQSPSIVAVKRSKASTGRTSDTTPTSILPRPPSLTNLLLGSNPQAQPAPEAAVKTQHPQACPATKKDAALLGREDDEQSQAETPVVDTHAAASSPAAALKGSSPQSIPAGDRRSSSGRELEASSYYQGLLQHEPAALRILLRAAMERPGPAAADSA